jgi:Na+/H+ antiporter NhaC
MSPALIMVILASTLGVFLKDDLQTGTYLATTVLKSIPLFLLPCMLFFVSTGMAIITGSSWGTIAILTPISIQMLLSLTTNQLPIEPENIPLLFSLLGAIFSGAVCGDHISPLSETTIMSSTSAGCYPIDHAYTQFPYALPAIVGTGLAFLCAGILTPWGKLITLVGALSTGLISCLLLIALLNHHHAKKSLLGGK